MCAQAPGAEPGAALSSLLCLSWGVKHSVPATETGHQLLWLHPHPAGITRRFRNQAGNGESLRRQSLCLGFGLGFHISGIFRDSPLLPALSLPALPIPAPSASSASAATLGPVSHFTQVPAKRKSSLSKAVNRDNSSTVIAQALLAAGRVRWCVPGEGALSARRPQRGVHTLGG